jgi:DNA polymerase I
MSKALSPEYQKLADEEELNLNIKLQLDDVDESVKERVRKTVQKVKTQKYEPTWDEIWHTGYTTHTGKFKKGIFQTKLTDKDREKLVEVKEAIERGVLGTFIEDGSMRKFTKTHALRLHKILQESKKESIINELVENIPDNYLLINTVDSFEKLIRDLWKEEEIAVDTETTGLNYFETYAESVDKIVGISITLPKADYHVYIPINHTKGKQLPEEFVLNGLKPVLESTKIKKIMFNAKFDIHMFIRHGIYIGGFYFDGLIGMKLLNENEPSYMLKNLATKYGKYFGFEDKSQTYEELFGKGGFQDAEFERDGKRWIGTLYPCKDTHLTYKFYKDFVSKHFDRLPKIKRLYYEIEKPILEICVDMEQNGFLLDLDYAKEYEKTLTRDIEKLKTEMEQYFGDINLNSNQQLAEKLYDELGLPDVSKKRKVDAKTLKKLAKKHEGVKLLLKYRDLNKLLTTYVQPLPLKVATDSKRLHGTFNQVDTATGRFASKNPNLQNLPYEARKMIIAPEGKVIIGMDFSQIEPRVLSHMSNDKTMIGAYVNGRDLYIELAMKVFNLERKYCEDGAYDPTGTYQPRKRIKAVLLGIMYGMGAYTLSESIDSTVEEAEQIIKDFYKTYPDIKAFIDKTHKEAEEQQYVETMFGRKRRFIGHRQVAKKYKALEKEIIRRLGSVPSNIWSTDLPYELKAEFWEVSGPYHVVNRQSVNTKIQGSSADIMKMAMIRVNKVAKKYGFKILATVHDEVLLEVPETITREQIAELEDAMINTVNLKVPLKTDTEFMYRWGMGISKDEWFSGKRPSKVA